MYQYFSINLIISLITLLYITQFKTAPSRVSFRFVFIALLSWLLPYDLINTYFSNDNYTAFIPLLDEFRQTIKTTITSQVSTQTAFTLKQVLLLLSSIGFIAFIRELILLKKTTQALDIKFYKTIDSSEVYISDKPIGAFCAGLINPKIYINAELINSDEVDSILQHELQHIKQYDTVYTMLLTFIQRVLWWNPLVLLFVAKARTFIELSCDEKTAQLIGKTNYQKDLATLLMKGNKDNDNKLTLSYYSKKNINLLRIKQLNKDIKMNKKHKSLIFTTAFIPLVISLFISTQTLSSTTKIKDEVEVATQLKANQLQIVFDSHLYYNFEFSNETDEKGNQVVSKKDHKSIESNLIATLNEPKTFSFGKEKEDVTFTIKQVKDEQYLFDFNITYVIDGKKSNYTPSLLVLKSQPASIEIKGPHSRFELNIRIIK